MTHPWPPAGLPTPYYVDEACVIYHTDCREIFPLLAEGSVDLVVTDPPYASGARSDAHRQVRGSMLRGLDDAEWFSHDSMTTWGLSWFMRSVLFLLRPALHVGVHIYWFTDWRMTPTVYGMLEASGYRVNQCLVWHKAHYGMGTYWRNQHENIVFASIGTPAGMLRHDMGSVLNVPTIAAEQRQHPTEKPLQLIKMILNACPGDVILDPFAGAATTMRAAKDIGRRAIGIEIEERYCEIAAKRLAQEVLPLRERPAPDASAVQRLFA